MSKAGSFCFSYLVPRPLGLCVVCVSFEVLSGSVMLFLGVYLQAVLLTLPGALHGKVCEGRLSSGSDTGPQPYCHCCPPRLDAVTNEKKDAY